MNQAYDVGYELAASLLVIITTFLVWLPSIIGALIIVLIGLFIAKLIRGLLEKALKSIRLETAVEKFGVNDLMKSSGIGVTVSDIFLWLAYWIVLLVFLSSAANVLDIPSITNFISVVIGYIPAIFAGLIIMLIGVIAANIFGDILEHVSHGKVYKKIVRWLILLVAFITAIEQLGFNLRFLTDNLTIIIAGLILAVGLAFGLGGKDHAKAFLDRHLR